MDDDDALSHKGLSWTDEPINPTLLCSAKHCFIPHHFPKETVNMSEGTFLGTFVYKLHLESPWKGVESHLIGQTASLSSGSVVYQV